MNTSASRSWRPLRTWLGFVADKILEVLGAMCTSYPLHPTHSFGLGSECFPHSLAVTSLGLGEVVGFHPEVFVISSGDNQEALGSI